MIIRSKAPLRIGLAGGGTDLESYSQKHGGAVFNATIGMYAYCTICPTDDGMIRIIAHDNKNSLQTKATSELKTSGDKLILHRGVYNRIVKDFNKGKPLSFIMSTSNDAPVGSGLGTSSTMVVAILEAFNCWLNLGLTKEQKAQLAYDIERKDLNLAGGKQDQYCAVYGGINYMQFLTDGSVVVEKLEIDNSSKNELESSMLLYYSGKSRSSANVQLALAKNIIDSQKEVVKTGSQTALNAMDNLKLNASAMRECVLNGDNDGIASLLRKGWEDKKKTSSVVSNVELEKTVNYALKHGADAVKVSGAGGGGFLLLYCNPIHRHRLVNAMNRLSGKVYPVKLTAQGAQSWTITGDLKWTL